MQPINRLLTLLALLSLTSGVFSQTHAPVDGELRSRLKQAVEASSSFKHRFEAEVWLLDMRTRLDKIFAGGFAKSRRFVSEDETLQMLRIIHQEATRAKVDPQLVLAVIHTESTFDRFAISKSGALGLMQVMPFWLKELDRPNDNLFDIRTNITMGVTILKFYIDKENGHVAKALARYNGSRGSWRYPKKVNQLLRRWWR